MKGTQKDGTGSPVEGDAAVELLAAALFCTSVRPEDRPAAALVRRVVCRRLGPGRTEAAACLTVATRAAAKPGPANSRMAWCRRAVMQAFPDDVAVPPSRRGHAPAASA